MYSSHSGQVCCKQWAKGLFVRSYWPLYSVNVSVPSQAVCGSGRAMGRRPRLRLRQVELGQVWTSRRLGCHIGPRQEVEFGSEHHNELRGDERAQHWVLLADKLPLHNSYGFFSFPSPLSSLFIFLSTFILSLFVPFSHCTKHWKLLHQKTTDCFTTNDSCFYIVFATCPRSVLK